MKRTLLLAALLAGTASAQQNVTIGLGYLPNVQFAPFYAAQKEGYFRREGLNVTFKHGYVSELMPLLLQGKIDFVVGDAEDAILAHAQGAPVKYVMAMYQRVPVTVFSLGAKGITKPADLRGKTVGIPGAFGSSYFAFQALLDANNLTERDVKLAQIGFTQLDAVRSGRVDAAVGFVNNEPLQLRANGQKVNTLSVNAAYPMVGVGLITTEKNLQGFLGRKVTRAAQQGVALTVRDPARAFRDSASFIGSGGGTLDVLKASTPLMTSAFTRANAVGFSDPATWTKAIAFLQKSKQVPAGVKATDFYTNSLLSKTVK
ncbi:ABC transporter substrate-binding protein [Deinococcus maricopensis]|uniref:Putative sulfonate/nitrate/taurine transport system substrate-binding protein n=1 Tax=Deinococcus maricopensis (strain DSM 21211 / LMG 22137 / NRRL B-23946 / LB-34) TaxID=709986 RepID=E8UBQ6_DEIML|nr:ABC transporter substrate-binding protein [Deinococcus maricopensis]ADV68495.1 putative sulfonate/nitrate/taurine transport system substrate-binding protein [Deinococcus maricopensis DSM 21211]